MMSVREQPRKPKLEAVLNEVAAHHKKGSLESIGVVKEKHVAKARENFAKDMADSETPLAMIDGSLMQQGSSGVLVTDCRLYSSKLTSPIHLKDISNVVAQKPTTCDYVMSALFGLFYGPVKATLRVNGHEAYSGRMKSYWRLWNPELWEELLTKLAQASRE